MRNPKLYKAIRKAFGQTPKIVNDGMPCRLMGVYAEYSFTPQVQDLPPSATSGGEQYAVNCPHCGDTRQRLYISHMWGTEFVQNNVRYRCSEGLIHCFNEDCFGLKVSPEVAKYRREKLTAQLRKELGEITEIDGEELEESEDTCSSELAHQSELPDELHKLDDPNTPKEVLQYIAERGFNPRVLQDIWEVGWVPCHGKFHHPLLVIPVKQNGDLWFWQGRLVPLDGHVGGPLERSVVTGKEFPKYFFPPSVKKAWCLYNLDRARLSDTVLLVEGVTDVWALGPTAIARFGKSLSGAQVQLMSEQCFGKHIIIVPDRDDPQAVDCAKEDAMRLEIQGAFASVKLAFPPEGMDPADMAKANQGKDLACLLKSQALSLSQVNTIPGTSGSLVMM